MADCHLAAVTVTSNSADGASCHAFKSHVLFTWNVLFYFFNLLKLMTRLVVFWPSNCFCFVSFFYSFSNQSGTKMISASGGITLFPAKNPRPGPDPGGGSSSTGPIVLGGGGGGGCNSSINQINMESLGCQASANTRSNAGMVCRESCSTTRLVSYFISFLAFFSATSKNKKNQSEQWESRSSVLYLLLAMLTCFSSSAHCFLWVATACFQH